MKNYSRAATAVKNLCLCILAGVLLFSTAVPAYAAGNLKMAPANLSSSYGPSSDDLDYVGGKKIKYPRKESFYLDDYVYGEVSKKKAVAFINPNASDVMADNNTFTVRQGEEVTALAQSSGYMCVIFPELDRAGWISRSDLELYLYYSPRVGARPSAADLDEIYADVKYPNKSTYYLKNYIETTVKRGTGLVYLNPNSSNVTADKNTFDVKKGEEAIIIAESNGLACCIFPNLARAGWIGVEYLSKY